YLAPGAGPALEYSREGFQNGEWWRGLTGHWVHFSLDHLFWDLAAFISLGTACERVTRKGFLLCVLVSACVISAMLWRIGQELSFYRGLSGVDTALMAYLVVHLIHRGFAGRRFPDVALAGIFALGILGKLCYEACSASSLFVNHAGEGICCVPLAHGTGAVVGALIAVRTARSFSSPSSPAFPILWYKPRDESGSGIR
ncbi:MAG: rhombosortase, partial [Planctomycetes bacterium]|nr:rhombosortase [Planctomycetota bacterium]